MGGLHRHVGSSHWGGVGGGREPRSHVFGFAVAQMQNVAPEACEPFAALVPGAGGERRMRRAGEQVLGAGKSRMEHLSVFHEVRKKPGAGVSRRHLLAGGTEAKHSHSEARPVWWDGSTSWENVIWDTLTRSDFT